MPVSVLSSLRRPAGGKGGRGLSAGFGFSVRLVALEASGQRAGAAERLPWLRPAWTSGTGAAGSTARPPLTRLGAYRDDQELGAGIGAQFAAAFLCKAVGGRGLSAGIGAQPAWSPS